MSDNVEECPICLNNLKIAVYVPQLHNGTSCHHKFHYHCLKKYIKMCVLIKYNAETDTIERNHEVPLCPYCRQQIMKLYPVKKGAIFAVHRYICERNPVHDWLHLHKEGMSEYGFDGDEEMRRLTQGRNRSATPPLHPVQVALEDTNLENTGNRQGRWRINKGFIRVVLVFIISILCFKFI